MRWKAEMMFTRTPIDRGVPLMRWARVYESSRRLMQIDVQSDKARRVMSEHRYLSLPSNLKIPATRRTIAASGEPMGAKPYQHVLACVEPSMSIS